MGGPFFQFDLPGTRRIVSAVRRVEALANFDASANDGQYQGDAVLMPMQVVSIPANNSTYVITQPYVWNGSAGSTAPYNHSVAVFTTHLVGDLLYAIPVGCSLQHLTDANSLPILLQEIGPLEPVEFRVNAIPNMSEGVVEPYVWAVVNSNTSSGTMNISVGVIQAHDVNDTFFALPVSQIPSGSDVLKDDGTYHHFNLTGGSAVTWLEVGNYGMVFECGLNQSGGSNGSAGVSNTLSYIITTLGGVPLITSPQTPDRPPYVSQRTVNAATRGLARIDNGGNWFLIEAFDWNTGVQCNTSGGSTSNGSGGSIGYDS